MKRKFSKIEINLGDSKDRMEVVDGLRCIADQIEFGAYSGIAGWSDVSWNLTLEEESVDNDQEND